MRSQLSAAIFALAAFVSASYNKETLELYRRLQLFNAVQAGNYAEASRYLESNYLAPRTHLQSRSNPTEELKSAIEWYNTAKIESLVGGDLSKLDDISIYGVSPIVLAAQTGDDMRVADWMLEKGVNPNNGVDKVGNSALMCFIKHSGPINNMKTLKLFLDNGADIHHVNDAGENAFMMVCRGGSLKALEIIIQAGGHEGLNAEQKQTAISNASSNNGPRSSGVYERVNELFN